MSNWENIELGSVCEVVRGGSPRPIMDYITDDPDGVNWLKIGDVKENDKYFLHAAERIKRSGISKTREVKVGDLILSNSMSFGRAFITLIDGYIHDGWLRLRCNEERLDKEYLYYFLTSNLAQNQFKAIANGSVVNNLKSDTVKAVRIDLPPIGEQRKIATALSMFDNKIKCNEEINENLTEQARSIFQSWFIDYEPYGGIMPSDWQPSTLDKIAVMKTDIWSPSKNPDVVVEHYSIPAYDEKHYPVYEIASGIKSNKYILTPDSVMISKLNPDTKRIWRPMCLSEHPVCSTEFIVYEAKKKGQRDYIYSLIDSVPFLQYLCSHTTGSTNSRQRATPKSTLEFPICLPPDPVIEDFCQLVTPMYDLIASNLVENQSLAKARDSLLPRLMSGELDISDLDF